MYLTYNSWQIISNFTWYASGAMIGGTYMHYIEDYMRSPTRLMLLDIFKVLKN